MIEKDYDICDPIIFVIDEFNYKLLLAHPYEVSDFTQDLYEAIDKAVAEYAHARNMSVGYSRITSFIRKER